MNLFLQTLTGVFQILPQNLKKRFWLVLVVIIITGFVDLMGLASFIPLISAISDPSILKTEKLSFIQTSFGMQTDQSILFFLFASALLFFIFRTVFIIFSNWVQSSFVARINEYLGKSKYNYYLFNSYESFIKKDVAEIVRELTVNPQHFSKFLVMSLLLITSETFVIILVICAIAVYNFKILILLSITVFPIALLFNLLVKKRMRRYGETQNELTPILYSQSTRGMHGIVDVKLRNKEEDLLNNYSTTLKSLNQLGIITSVLAIVPSKLFELATVAGLVLIFAYGAIFLDGSSEIISVVAMYAAAGYRIIPSLSKIIPAFMQLEQFNYLFGIFKIDKLESRIENITSSQVETDSIRFDTRIRIEDLSFAFSETKKPILQNLSLEVKSGEFIGLVGRTGSGKSTLIKLIAGFLIPSSGKIEIDDLELKPSNTKAWMDRISYVEQNPYLEKGSLSNNIAFLEDKVDDDKLSKSIKEASLTDFVRGRNPDEIRIEESGKNLSGGQKQRIAIARALYHNSSLIILDEATSALDQETENEINDTIKGLKGSKLTVIIVAHRISTLKHCNRIIEIKSGKAHNVSYESIK